MDEDIVVRRADGDAPATSGVSSASGPEGGVNEAASSARPLESPEQQSMGVDRGVGGDTLGKPARDWGEQGDDAPAKGQMSSARDTRGFESAQPSGDREREPLLNPDLLERLSAQWAEIQADFVDRPRESVQRADSLVVDVMQRVTTSLSQQRGQLESQWEKGDDVSTEDLRVALTRYRSFFDRLLSA